MSLATITTPELYILPVDEQGYDQDLSQALDLLDERELARYHRFKVAHAQHSFLQARCITKTILGAKLGIPAKQVNFKYSDNGKPFVKNHFGDSLHFSLSHCKSAVALVVSPFNIGVDAEQCDRGKDVWRRTADFVNDTAAKQIATLNDEQAKDLFTCYWTSVEALVKLNDSSIYQERKAIQLDPSLTEHASSEWIWQSQYLRTIKYHTSFRVTLAAENSLQDMKVFRWIAPDNYQTYS